MRNRTREQKILSKEKEFNTKLKNGTLGNTISQSELECFKFLQNKFPTYTIRTQYFDKLRYPHFCDIYIEDLDLFIELNLFFTHGDHLPISEEDALNMDSNMPKGWNGVAVSDYNKYLEAQKNHLNYLVFYTLNDFYNMFNNCTFNKVTKIDVIDSHEDVYDIGVKDNNNMVLSNGLITHNCKPYQYLKNTIYEKRFVMYKSNRLFDEFVDIERNMNTGRIDHTPNNHKDALDAVCGATFTASKHADEYAFDYGESLDTFFNVNNEASNQTLQQQIVLDFENELKQIHSPLGKNSNVNTNLNKKNSDDTDTSRVWASNSIFML